MKRDQPLIHISISVSQGKITLYEKYVTQEYLGYITTHQQAKQTDALFYIILQRAVRLMSSKLKLETSKIFKILLLKQGSFGIRPLTS